MVLVPIGTRIHKPDVETLVELRNIGINVEKIIYKDHFYFVRLDTTQYMSRVERLHFNVEIHNVYRQDNQQPVFATGRHSEHGVILVIYANEVTSNVDMDDVEIEVVPNEKENWYSTLLQSLRELMVTSSDDDDEVEKKYRRDRNDFYAIVTILDYFHINIRKFVHAKRSVYRPIHMSEEICEK